MSGKWGALFKEVLHSGGRLPAYGVAVMRDAVKAEPEADVFWVLLGSELTSLRRLDEAEKALKRGLALTPTDRRRVAYCELGDFAVAAGDSRGAEEWYKKAIEAEPDNAAGRVYLGGLYADMGRLEDAEKVYRDATKCSVGWLDSAYHELGLVLRTQGRLDEAKDCFVRALELEPEYDRAREALEDVEKAIAYLADRA